MVCATRAIKNLEFIKRSKLPNVTKKDLEADIYFELCLSFSLALPSKLPRPPAIFLPTSSVLFTTSPPTLLMKAKHSGCLEF
jgi:hypothetical protein